MSHNEADICRLHVTPALQRVGWEEAPSVIREQVYFTDGRILVTGGAPIRKKGKRADYLLCYTRDLTIAVVEAKAEDESAGTGLSQAKDYAQILGLKFAYGTNGKEIREFDFTTGSERILTDFPSPAELWSRYCAAAKLTPGQAATVLTPCNLISGRRPRYYQEIAILRAVEAIAQGRDRLMLCLATGTGKTEIAFQIAWKLWSASWSRRGHGRKPRILFLADRNILVDDPQAKDFRPFGDARHRIESGAASQGREIYFATYQGIAEDERRPGLYREYPADFFDLIIIDECHRGSARDDSSWRVILDYFTPAAQLGLTATPMREESRDSYAYFGDPLFVYSLRQGIDDGFLAPYRVHRVITTWDAVGWRPQAGERDRYGHEIPDSEYGTKDFERIISMKARTQAVARHLTDRLIKSGDRFAKTIVFCVDQEHAEEMRFALSELNKDLVKQHPDWVARVTADEGEIGRGHLSKFQDVETRTPAILTTSQLLTTGVNAPMVKNVVLVRVIGSMTEFKQIIGRGTRVREDYGKLYFTIYDYTGSATKLFADPAFDGDPVDEDEEEIDEEGEGEDGDGEDGGDEGEGEGEGEDDTGGGGEGPEPPEPRQKFYVDRGLVGIAHEQVQDLGADGRTLTTTALIDHTKSEVQRLDPDETHLRQRWANPEDRELVLAELAERGIPLANLAEALRMQDADPIDLLCHIAYGAPLLTRHQRAEKLKTGRSDLFDQYGPEARAILAELLAAYADHGPDSLRLPDAFKVPPLSHHGNVGEIATLFGGAEQLRTAIIKLQSALYAA